MVASLSNVSVEIRQDETARWSDYIIQAADDAYLKNIDYDIGVLGKATQAQPKSGRRCAPILAWR